MTSKSSSSNSKRATKPASKTQLESPESLRRLAAVVKHSQEWAVLEELLQMEQQDNLEASARSDDPDKARDYRAVYRWLDHFLGVVVPSLLDGEAALRAIPDPSTQRNWGGGSDFMASDSGSVDPEA